MEEERARSTAIFRFNVNNFKNLNTEVWSSNFYVQNLPWNIMVQTQPGQTKYLSVYLVVGHVGQLASDGWSCSAIVKLQLISHKPGFQPYCVEFEKLFNSTHPSQGYLNFMEWNEILDPENGYIKDDAITIEAHIIAKPPNGLLTIKEEMNIQTDEISNTIAGTIKIPYNYYLSQYKYQVKYMIYPKNSYDRFEFKFLLHWDKQNYDVHILYWNINCDDVKTAHELQYDIGVNQNTFNILNLRCFEWKKVVSVSSKLKEIKYTLRPHTEMLPNKNHVFTPLKDDLDLQNFTLKNDNMYEVKINDFVMACQSKVFYTMLHGDWNERKDNVYTIKNITDDALKQLADYLYTGEVSKENSFELLSFAMMYEIHDLVNKCMVHIYERVTCENAIQILHEALNIYSCKLVRGILYFIQENINEVKVNFEKKTNRKLNSFLHNAKKQSTRNIIFAPMRNDIHLTDYVLKNDNNYEVKIHKVVITCQSMFFYKILTDKRENKYIIENMSDGVLKNLVDYLYTGHVPEENLRELLSFAVKYEMTDLADICMAHIYKSITCENAMQMLHDTLKNNWSQLTLSSLNFIIVNLDEVFENFQSKN